MMRFHPYLFCTVVLLFADSVFGAGGCLPNGAGNIGFNARFFNYTLADTSDFQDPSFMGGGYLNNLYQGETSNIINPTIYYKSGAVFDYGDIYGFETTATNFVVELTGYFLAPQTGNYNFSMVGVDDGAIFQLGNGVAFDCCAQMNSTAIVSDFTINATKPWLGDLGRTWSVVSLQEGIFYPVKIVFVNIVEDAYLNFYVSLPDGTTLLDDFTGYIISFPADSSQQQCEYPPPLISTTYTPWTGTYTTTFSTETTESVGDDGSTTPETIYHIETPTPSGIVSTTYTPWTGTYTTTFSTETTESVGDDGSTTPETIYHVETPTPSGIVSTTYTPWTGTYTTTFSTETTESVGDDGSTTPETIYHVETPYSFYYVNSSTPASSLASSGDPAATLSTVTVISNGITTEYTTTCPESHISKNSRSTFFSTSYRGVSMDSYEGIVSTTTPNGGIVTTLKPEIVTSGTAQESSHGTISLSEVSPFTAHSTATSISLQSTDSESLSSNSRVVTSMSQENTNLAPEGTTKTIIRASDANSIEKPSSSKSSYITQKPETKISPTSTISFEAYSSTISSVTSVIVSAYAGDAGRLFLNYVGALAAVFPLAFI